MANVVGAQDLFNALRGRKSSAYRAAAIANVATMTSYGGCVPVGRGRAAAKAVKRMVMENAKRGGSIFGAKFPLRVQRVRINGKIHYCAVPRMNARHIVRRRKRNR